MSILVTFFGPMTDVTQKDNEQLNINSTDELRDLLTKQYPDSEGVNYSISVNQEVVDENTFISESDEIAILPPFAGG